MILYNPVVWGSRYRGVSGSKRGMKRCRDTELDVQKERQILLQRAIPDHGGILSVPWVIKLKDWCDQWNIPIGPILSIPPFLPYPPRQLQNSFTCSPLEITSYVPILSTMSFGSEHSNGHLDPSLAWHWQTLFQRSPEILDFEHMVSFC